MAEKNQIKFKVFIKAVEKYIQRHFAKYHITQKKGSGIRIDVFVNKNDYIASEMWVIHEDKYVHKGDLKKTCDKLNITVDDFLDLL